jgi:hypothetical protein
MNDRTGKNTPGVDGNCASPVQFFADYAQPKGQLGLVGRKSLATDVATTCRRPPATNRN